jgi:citrate synthase
MNARSAPRAMRALRVSPDCSSSREISLTFCKPIAARSVALPVYRTYATSSEPDLKTTFKECIAPKRELLKKVKALGGKVIGDVKVENTIGGMR